MGGYRDLGCIRPYPVRVGGKYNPAARSGKLVFLLTLLALLSVPLALDPLLAWNGFVDYLKVILMFVVLINVVRTESRLKLLLFLILVVSCVLSIAALNDYADAAGLISADSVSRA